MAPLPRPNTVKVIARIEQTDGRVHMTQLLRQPLQLLTMVLHFTGQFGPL